jgi:hypothetical protein
LGFVARGLLKAVLVSKNRTRTIRWQEVVEHAQEIQQKQDTLKQERRQQLNEDFPLFRSLQRNQMANDQPMEQVGFELFV